MSLAHAPAELPDVEVLDNTSLGETSLDAEGWAYVAIWTEAVTITAKPFGSDYLITELIWGRPRFKHSERVTPIRTWPRSHVRCRLGGRESLRCPS